MFGTSQVQHGVVNRHQEIIGQPLELPGQWSFAEIFDDVVFDQTPELAG